MYYPPLVGGLDNTDSEFVELYNPSASPVALSDSFDTNHDGSADIVAPWLLSGGVDFSFAQGTTIAGYGTLLVVSFDPSDPLNAGKLAAFKTLYSVPAGVTIVGPYSGKLSNGGEKVELLRSDEPPAENPTLLPYVLEDQVNYDVAAPWPTGALGTGESITRLGAGLWGDDAASWVAAAPSAGKFSPASMRLVLVEAPTSGATAPTLPDAAELGILEDHSFYAEMWVRSNPNAPANIAGGTMNM